MGEMQTRGSLIAWASALLAAAGVESARLDARLLVAHALRLDTDAIRRAPAIATTAAERARVRRLLRRRVDGMPVARLIGVREFWSLPFRLSRATLVPRPDSETVVEAVLARRGTAARRLLDLGTGSGCLCLALLHERPSWTGLGLDRSAGALATAAANARALGLASRVDWRRGDWTRGLAGPFDVVVANPPYIESGAIAALAPEVRADPRLALDGGADGLDAYRAILADLGRLLAPGALVALEIGATQALAVAGLMLDVGLTRPVVVADLAGLPRVVLAEKDGQPGTQAP
jgi:release factor glutamine methyltransferase